MPDGLVLDSMKPEKKKKIEKELEQIKRMQSINDIIDRGSSENTLLYTSSRENESLGDGTIDKMLDRMASTENEREIRTVEDMTKASAHSEELERRRHERPRARHGRSAARQVHRKTRHARNSSHRRAKHQAKRRTSRSIHMKRKASR